MRVAIVLVAAALGALGAIGCAITALLDLQGFGGPRDQEPALGHLIALAVGFAVSIGVPLALWRVLLPDAAPATAVVVFVIACALVLSLLGVTLGR